MPYEIKQYRDLAAGYLSEQKLSEEVGMRDAVGIGVYIEDLETRIIRKALFLGAKLQPQTTPETDTFGKTLDTERSQEEKAIEESGGELIGGSVISRGYAYGSKPGTTFRPGPKRLDSFERGGKITTQTGEFADHDFSRAPDHDDYGEESGA
jgi:hypothetical protein